MSFAPRCAPWKSSRSRTSIEDILITLGGQYHLIRLLNGRNGQGLFLYPTVNKNRANLAMARHQLRPIEANLEL